MRGDEQSGLKTIPLVIGVKKSMILANVLTLLFLLISIYHYQSSSVFTLLAFVISAISTLYFLNSKTLQKSSFYHYGILDGTMLLQGTLLWIFYFFLS